MNDNYIYCAVRTVNKRERKMAIDRAHFLVLYIT